MPPGLIAGNLDRSNTMSISCVDKVFRYSKAKGSPLVVELAIADSVNEERGFAWPAIDTLARKSRVTERHLRRIIKHLTAIGELEITLNAGPHGVNHYRLILPAVAHTGRKCPPVKRDRHPDVGVPSRPDIDVPQSIKEPLSKNKDHSAGHREADALAGDETKQAVKTRLENLGKAMHIGAKELRRS